MDFDYWCLQVYEHGARKPKTGATTDGATRRTGAAGHRGGLGGRQSRPGALKAGRSERQPRPRTSKAGELGLDDHGSQETLENTTEEETEEVISTG